MGRVYAVASGKGGVGKTTTAAALGATLASAGASVAVVDADLGMANLGPALGVDDGPPTLHDVLAGEATVADATREGPDGLAVVPGSRDLDAFADARPEALGEAVGALADEYDHVFVDSGAGLSTDSLAPLRTADEVVLVATPDRDALRNADKTAEVCRRLGTPVRGLVLTRADADANDRIRNLVDHEVLEAVPDDPAVTAALEAASPLTRYAPESPAAAAYRDLARTLTGVDVPEPEATTDADGGESEPTAADAGAGDSAETAADSGEGSDVAEAAPTADAGVSGDDADDDEAASPDLPPSDDDRGEEPADEERSGTDAGSDPNADAVEEDGTEAGATGASDDADAADDDTDDGGRKGFFSRLFG